jgi:serralysin
LTHRLSDDDADGTPEIVESYVYDSNGNVTRFLFDYDADGRPDLVTRYQYDVNENQTRRLMDINGDGTPEMVDSYVYDANSNLIRHENDEDADGTPQYIESWQYDSYGNPTRYEEHGDWDGGPHTIVIWQYEYDADGSLTVTMSSSTGETDILQYDTSGKPILLREGLGIEEASARTRSFEYHANGKQARGMEAWDDDHDGAPDRIDSGLYDSNGNLTQKTTDLDGDGTPEDFINYEYDANQNLIRLERLGDNNGDGTPEPVSSCQYQYDVDGNVTREDGDCEGVGEDGTPNTFLIIKYKATGWGHIFTN